MNTCSVLEIEVTFCAVLTEGMTKDRLKNTVKSILFSLPFNVSSNFKYDRQLIRVMKKHLKKDSNCIDVGCHKGEILKFMLKFAPEGKHYGFEPIPEMYDVLKSSFSNCNILNIGLSDQQKQVSFNHVKSNPAYSGFKKRSYPTNNEKIEVITVNTDLLDNVIPADKKIDFIKIDVEGAEFEVLKGAVNTIKKWKPIIVFEHGLGASDFYNTNPEDIYTLLCDECDLHLSLMENWMRNSPPLSQASFKKQFHEKLNYYFIAYPKQ